MKAFLIFPIAVILYMTNLIFAQTTSNEMTNQDMSKITDESSFSIGISVGTNYSIHNGKYPLIFRPENFHGYAENLTGYGLSGGISLEYLLDKRSATNCSMIIKLLYKSMPSSDVIAGPKYPVRVEDGNGQEVIKYTNTNLNLELIYDYMSLETLFKVSLFDNGFGVLVGTNFGYNVSAKGSEKYVYNYQNHEDNIKLKLLNGVSAFRFGLVGGIQYDFSFDNIHIIPSFSYDYALTKTQKEYDWYVNALQACIDLRFDM